MLKLGKAGWYVTLKITLSFSFKKSFQLAAPKFWPKIFQVKKNCEFNIFSLFQKNFSVWKF